MSSPELEKFFDTFQGKIVEAVSPLFDEFCCEMRSSNIIGREEIELAKTEKTSRSQMFYLFDILKQRGGFINGLRKFLHSRNLKWLLSEMSRQSALSVEPADDEKKLGELRAKLAIYYRETFGIVHIFKESEDVENLFVELELEHQKEKMQDYRVALRSLLSGEHQGSRASLIEKLMIVWAQPGFGKTTLLKKICYDWANVVLSLETVPIPEATRAEGEVYKMWLKKVDLLFVFQLRYFDGEVDEILDIFRFASSLFSDDELLFLDRWLPKNQSKILVLLDGLDELRSTAYCKELHELLHSSIPWLELHFPLVITSRPYTAQNVNSHFSAKICGLRENQFVVFVEKRCKKARAKQLLLDYIYTNGYLKETILRCPLLLLMLCRIADDDGFRGDLPTTQTALYLAMCAWLQRSDEDRADKNTRSAHFSYREWIEMPHISELAKLAYEKSSIGTLVFFDSELSETCAKKAKSVGLIVDDSLLRLPGQRFGLEAENARKFPDVCFLHRTFQEFFAALAAAEKPQEFAKVVSKMRFDEVCTLDQRWRENFDHQFFIFFAGATSRGDAEKVADALRSIDSGWTFDFLPVVGHRLEMSADQLTHGYGLYPSDVTEPILRQVDAETEDGTKKNLRLRRAIARLISKLNYVYEIKRDLYRYSAASSVGLFLSKEAIEKLYDCPTGDGKWDTVLFNLAKRLFDDHGPLFSHFFGLEIKKFISGMSSTDLEALKTSLAQLAEDEAARPTMTKIMANGFQRFAAEQHADYFAQLFVANVYDGYIAAGKSAAERTKLALSKERGEGLKRTMTTIVLDLISPRYQAIFQVFMGYIFNVLSRGAHIHDIFPKDFRGPAKFHIALFLNVYVASFQGDDDVRAALVAIKNEWEGSSQVASIFSSRTVTDSRGHGSYGVVLLEEMMSRPDEFFKNRKFFLETFRGSASMTLIRCGEYRIYLLSASDIDGSQYVYCAQARDDFIEAELLDSTLQYPSLATRFAFNGSVDAFFALAEECDQIRTSEAYFFFDGSCDENAKKSRAGSEFSLGKAEDSPSRKIIGKIQVTGDADVSIHVSNRTNLDLAENRILQSVLNIESVSRIFIDYRYLTQPAATDTKVVLVENSKEEKETISKLTIAAKAPSQIFSSAIAKTFLSRYNAQELALIEFEQLDSSEFLSSIGGFSELTCVSFQADTSSLVEAVKVAAGCCAKTFTVENTKFLDGWSLKTINDIGAALSSTKVDGLVFRKCSFSKTVEATVKGLSRLAPNLKRIEVNGETVFSAIAALDDWRSLD